MPFTLPTHQQIEQELKKNQVLSTQRLGIPTHEEIVKFLPSTNRPIIPTEPIHKIETGPQETGTIEGLNLQKLGQSFVGGLKATPGQFETAGGIILANLTDIQRKINRAFIKTTLKILPGGEKYQPKESALTIQGPIIGSPEYARQLKESGYTKQQKAEEEFKKTYTPSTGLQGYLEMAAYNVPQMAVSYGLALATEVVTKNPILATEVGLSTSYGLNANDVYVEARTAGLSDNEAMPLAMIGGSIMGALDVIPLERLIRKTGLGSTVKKPLLKMITEGMVDVAIQSGMEGVTEGLQQIVQNAVAQTYNKHKDLFEGVKESAVVGALLGGFSDVTVSGVIGLTGKKSTPEEVGQQIKEKIQKAIEIPREERTPQQEEVVKALSTIELTPDEAMKMLAKNEIKGDTGKQVFQAALQAQRDNKNIKISPTEDETALRVEIVEPSVPKIIKQEIKKRRLGESVLNSIDPEAIQKKLDELSGKESEDINQQRDYLQERLRVLKGEITDSKLVIYPNNKNLLETGKLSDKIKQTAKELKEAPPPSETVEVLLKNLPEETKAELEMVKEAIDSGDLAAAQELYSGIEGIKPAYEKLLNAVNRERELEMKRAQKEGVVDKYAKYGNSADDVKYLVKVFRLLAEKKSKKTGLLFREHIPEGKNGQLASDEVATALGISENVLMKQVEALAKGETLVKKGTTSAAAIGGFESLPNLTKIQSEVKIVPFPEMVGLTRELMNKYPVVKKQVGTRGGQKALGVFIGKEGGKIKLRADIFSDIETATKTLAHEIGHLVDYLPDELLSRGNLLGRLATLKKHIAGTYGNLSTNKAIRNELMDLSAKWRGEFERKGGSKYDKYRRSSKELYADAISVLFNDPKRLQTEAPKFWQGFIEYLDRKPAVQENLFVIWDLLNEPADVVQEKRLNAIYEGFAEAKAIRKGIMEEKLPRQSIMERVMSVWAGFMRQHITRFDPIYRKVDSISKDYGIIISPKQRLRMQLEEMQMRRNAVYLYLDSVIKDITSPLDQLGMTEDDLGTLLKLERELGDRKDIANPYGLQGEYAQETLDYFKKHLAKRGIGDEQFNILQQSAGKFRELTFSVVEQAAETGVYSKKFFNETAKPNKDTYATFQVIEYIHNNYVTPAIKEAIGTLKPIENPATSSILKTAALIEQIELQKGKRAVVDQLLENFPTDISKSKPVKPKGVRVGWKKVKNRVPLELFEDGKRIAYDVDPYIAQMFDFYLPGEIHNIVKASGAFNRLFKPVVTTYNISWGFYANIIRDAKRTYKNLGAILPQVGNKKGLSIIEFISEYLKAIPGAYRYQNDVIDPLVREALDYRAFTTPFTKFDTTANEAEWLKPIIKRYRPVTDDVKQGGLKEQMLKPVRKILNGIELVGSTFETTSKVAGYQLTKKRELSGREAGFITRNYVGTPNFIDGGNQKVVDNNVFVFSNVALQALRTDFELATNPQTRSGYWMKTFQVDILPKMLMLAGIAGLFGATVKEILDKATEYDKTNYIIVPLGLRKNGKATYWRIPQDETGRLFSAVVWKLGTYLNHDLKKPEQIGYLLSGYIPSMTPLWEIGGAWMNVLQGKNPYDNYRGRPVVDDITWKAGGLPMYMKMIKWTTNELGFSQFTTYSDETDTTLDYLLKNIPLVNRAIKSTDYGMKESEQVIKKELDKQAAQRVLKERKILADYIKRGKENPESVDRLKKELVREVVGDKILTEADRRRRTNTLKKFKIGLIKGEVSQEMDSLIEATTNDEKVELMKLYKKSLTPEQYDDLLNTARKNKVISDEALKRIRREVGEAPTDEQNLLLGFLESAHAKIVPDVLAAENWTKADWEREKANPKPSFWEKVKRAITRLFQREPVTWVSPTAKPEGLTEKTDEDPYRVRDLLNGKIEVSYPNGQTSIFDTEEEKDRALAAWQKMYPEVTGKEWPDGAPNYIASQEAAAEVQQSSKNPEPIPTSAIVSGFKEKERKKPNEQIGGLINSAAENSGVVPAVMASIFFSESGFNPGAKNQNSDGSWDVGIAQLNSNAHPNVTQEQALDPVFSIVYATKIIKQNLKTFEGDYAKAIVAYNRGVNRVKSKDIDTLGKQYLNKVVAGIDPVVLKELGLKISY